MRSRAVAAEWQAAIEGFEVELEGSGRAAATVAGYRRHVEWLAEGVTVGPWVLTTPSLVDWLDGRRWSAETRRKVVVSLRAFYAWATAAGLTQWAPTAGIATSNHKRPGPARARLSPVWREALAEFTVFLQAGSRSAGTIEQRRWWLGRLAEAAADPWQVTGPQLALWISNPDWQPATRRMARSSVRSFYLWAHAAGRIERSPVVHLPSVRVPRALPRPAPDDALFEAMQRADDRQRLVLLIGMYAGLRRSEIAALHTRDFAGGVIHVVGKGGDHRRVPLHPDVATAVTAEVSRRRAGGAGSGFNPEHARADGWLFPSVHGGHLTPAHLGKVVGRVLPGAWTTHTLRHRFATQAYGVDRDLRAVQELLGHTKPETTAVYAASPADALARAVAGVQRPW